MQSTSLESEFHRLNAANSATASFISIIVIRYTSNRGEANLCNCNLVSNVEKYETIYGR